MNAQLPLFPQLPAAPIRPCRHATAAARVRLNRGLRKA
jgi:hypothetical protein